jgi:cytochrome c2
MRNLLGFIGLLVWSSLGFAANLDLNALKASIPSQTVRVFDPLEKKEIEYVGLPLKAVLDKTFGPDWKKREEALFICSDGYRAPVSIQRIQEHDAFLAFERKGSDRFAITEKVAKPREVDVGPFYLVWENIHDQVTKAEGGNGWPFQVVGIDLITFAERYPGLTPPAKASASAKRGYEVFRKHCVSCHALDGQGGKLGPELNTPVSVTEYFKEPWLKKWIINPSALRAGTSMPAVVPAGPEQGRKVDDLIAYLKTMSKKKN